MNRTAMLLVVYMGLLALGWPVLPFNMQASDLLVPVIALCLFGQLRRWTWRSLDVAVLLCLAGSAASLPRSIDIATSTVTLVKDLSLVAIYAVLTVAIATIGVRRMCAPFAAASAGLCVVGLLCLGLFLATGGVWPLIGEPMPLPYVGSVFRISATHHTPELFGNLLAVAIPVALAIRWTASTAERTRWNIALAAMVVAEAFTFSKAAGGCALAIALVLGGLSTRRQPVVAAGLVAVLLVFAFNLTAIVAVRRIGIDFGKDRSVARPDYLYAWRDDGFGADSVDVRIAYNPMSYYLLKKAGWESFLRRPWFGAGIGTFPLEAERAYQEGRLPQSYRRSSSHSLPFGRLTETGIVGALSMVPLIVVLWRRGVALWRSRDPFGVCIAAALAGLFINSINVEIQHFRFLWFGVALVRAYEWPRLANPAVVG